MVEIAGPVQGSGGWVPLGVELVQVPPQPVDGAWPGRSWRSEFRPTDSAVATALAAAGVEGSTRLSSPMTAITVPTATVAASGSSCGTSVGRSTKTTSVIPPGPGRALIARRDSVQAVGADGCDKAQTIA